MILRRVIEHFRKQEWTAIFLDFVIVVAGVFVGLQVNTWNAARADESAYEDALRRLAEENGAMLRDAESLRATIGGMLADVQPAIDALRNCRTGPEAEAIVNSGLNAIRSIRGLGVSTLAIDQLVSDERLLHRQSDEERASLRRYHADLHDIDYASDRVSTHLSLTDLDMHPLIGFTELVDPSKTFNKVDVRRVRIAAPVDEACKDPSFLKLFYAWERTHIFQLNLIDDLEETINARAAAPGVAPAAAAKDAAP